MTTVTAGFDLAAWSRIPVTTPLHRAEWLQVMASRIPGDPVTIVRDERLAFFGAIVRDPEAYEAYNPRALLWRDPPVFPVPHQERRRARLTALGGAPRHLLPALVLVAPGYVGDPAGPDRHDPDAVLACLADAADWCRAEALAGMYVLYAQSSAVREAVEALGGTSFPLTDRCVLPVWWHDWDSYLGGFDDSHRRGEIRRERRRSSEAGLELGRVEVEERFDEVLDGRCSLLRRYGQRADRGAERQRLGQLRTVFGEDLLAYGAFRGGDLVACSIAVRHERALTMIYAGVTDAGHALPYAYFAAAFYAVVEHTDRNVLEEIDYGIGHGRGKLLRGCSATPLAGHALGLDDRRNAQLREAAALLSPDLGHGNARTAAA